VKNSEKGQVLPLVLAALAIGSVVITPFLTHASTSLIGSRTYGQAIAEQYTADAGVEHAIWRLTNGGLANELSSPGDSTTYQLSETINNIAPSITVTRINSSSPIYAFRGGGSNAFWRYDIQGNIWTAMANAPANVGSGGALTYDGSYIYAFGGSSTRTFWRYDIQANTWTTMTDAPANVGSGGALTYDGNYVYAFRGGTTKTFWRYDIQADTWTTRADAPANVGSGGALTYSGSYIYAFRGGNTKAFWRYDIQANTWTTRANAPANLGDGGALTYDGSYIYAFRGGTTRAFWRYDIQGDTWTTMTNAPANVGGGGAFTNEIGANYELISTAGDNTVRAEVRIAGGAVFVLSWEVE